MPLTATKSPTAAQERDRALAYVLVRLAIGASLFGHGLVRLSKLRVFHDGLMGEFKTSILPEILVSPCGYALPFAEFAIGALLLVGALTRAAAIAGGLVMIVLVFGSTTIEHFGVIGDQLIHASLLVAVLTSAAQHLFHRSHAHPQQATPRRAPVGLEEVTTEGAVFLQRRRGAMLHFGLTSASRCAAAGA